MVLLFENGFSGRGQFLQSFCRSTREYVISLVASPLVIWQIHLCSCKSFAKIVPVPKNYIVILFVNVTTFYSNIFWLVRNPFWSSLIHFGQIKFEITSVFKIYVNKHEKGWQTSKNREKGTQIWDRSNH